MERKPRIRLGGTFVKREPRAFILTDVYQPTVFVRIEDADTADLIEFLYSCSESARSKLKLEVLSNSASRNS
jgi:hypothetical protein